MTDAAAVDADSAGREWVGGVGLAWAVAEVDSASGVGLDWVVAAAGWVAGWVAQAEVGWVASCSRLRSTRPCSCTGRY